jgi:1,4-alpha-glucan branching enzyme
LLTPSGIVQLDPWLEPFKDSLKSRFAKAKKWIDTINQTEGGLEKFSRGFEKFGFTFADNGDITYREWVYFLSLPSQAILTSTGSQR